LRCRLCWEVWALAVLCLHGLLRLYDVESRRRIFADAGAHCAVVGILITRKILGLAACALVAGTIAFIVVLSFRDTAMALIADPGWTRAVLVGSLVPPIVYGVVAMERRGKLKAFRWIVELGDAPYSTHLSHVLVLSALGRLFALIAGHNTPEDADLVIACVVGGNAVGWRAAA
jgi:peptidoglycan/LPS O-acetylase OafA/YrhL